MGLGFLLLWTAASLLLLASSKSYPQGILEGVTEDELENIYHCESFYDVDYSTDIEEEDICHNRGPWLFVGAYGLFGYDTVGYSIGAFGRQSTICDKTRDKRSNGVIWTLDFSSFKIAPFWAPLSFPLLWQMVNPANLRVVQQPSYYGYDPKQTFLRKKIWSCPEPTVPPKFGSLTPRNAPTVTLISAYPPSKLQPTSRSTFKPSPKPTPSHPSHKPSLWPTPGETVDDYSYYSR